MRAARQRDQRRPADIAFDSFRLWIGDELNGFDAVTEIKPADPAWSDDAAITHWLQETALVRASPSSLNAKPPSLPELFCTALYTLTGGKLKGLMVDTIARQLGVTFEAAEALTIDFAKRKLA